VATLIDSEFAVNDIAELRRGFDVSLRSRNRAAGTIKSYLQALDLFSDFAHSAGFPTAVDRINREHAETFIGDQLARWTPKTAAIRYGALLQFFKWCVDEGEISDSPMAKMGPPSVPEVPVPVVGDDDLKKLLGVLAGHGSILSARSPVSIEVATKPSADPITPEDFGCSWDAARRTESGHWRSPPSYLSDRSAGIVTRLFDRRSGRSGARSKVPSSQLWDFRLCSATLGVGAQSLRGRRGRTTQAGDPLATQRGGRFALGARAATKVSRTRRSAPT
jgi:hypothetical protein